MGCRTYSYIWYAMPIGGVVLASETKFGKIANLVMLISCRCERAHKIVIHCQAQILVNLFDLVGLPQLIKRRALLVHQSIGRDVLYVQLERAPEILLPVGHGLVREPKHQVYADIAYALLPQMCHGLFHFGRGVTAAEKT